MRERELLVVVIEVLSAVVVDVDDAHRVVKVGIPRRREMHGQRQVLVSFSGEFALELMDRPVHQSDHGRCR
jgi:hypothetical protein